MRENITLNDEPTRWGIIDVGERLRRARAALTDFGLESIRTAPMSSLDLATQQLVIIARALAKKARLLILDEPTAALTQNESLRLFERMRSLKERGVAIIFVSHRLAEVFAISDRIVVMRDGRICGEHKVAEVSRQEVVTEMIGDTAAASKPRQKRISRAKPRWRYTISPSSSGGPDASRRAGPNCPKGEKWLACSDFSGPAVSKRRSAVYGAWRGEARGIDRR